MALNMKTSYSMALTFAASCTTAPIPSERISSLIQYGSGSRKAGKSKMNLGFEPEGREFSLYKGISNRPLGWKARKQAKPALGQATRNANVKKWDGAGRCKVEWDGLRRDPELWCPEGDCLVHLYGQGQSRRGPAFKVPFEALLQAGCYPLLDRYLAQDFDVSSSSDSNYSYDLEYMPAMSGCYELYIPAPATSEPSKAMFYHIATRNFFAWLLGKSLVGHHLGGTLVTLLNSMNDFRQDGSNNERDILDFMDEEGYADMRNQPDYALAILYFAEHFRFRDVWIDAYAHCAGMNEVLSQSTEYEHISHVSSEMIRIGRFEMEDRLDRCGRSLSTFLEDELSPSHLGLTAGCREHLDRFRSFLQAYYVEKFGYYPPKASTSNSKAFPKEAYELMIEEFQNLYNLLVDETFTSDASSPVLAQGGLCVLQNIRAFDERHFYEPLPHPLPLLPEIAIDNVKPLNRHFSWTGKPDKMKLDSRLVNLNSLAKASNRRNPDLLRCPLVRAYREFEKECIFPNVTADKDIRSSLADARKVRWILIYAMLQTLICATKIPNEVRDIENVLYNLYVPTAGCPPWQEEITYDLQRPVQMDQAGQEWEFSSAITSTDASSPYAQSPKTPSAIEPDIDYFSIKHSASRASSMSDATPSPIIPWKSSKRKGSIRTSTISRALATLGNMPEMRHPRPIRKAFHEILDQGYGESICALQNNDSAHLALGHGDSQRRNSSESDSSSSGKYSEEALSPTWSQSEYEVNRLSPPSSIGDSERPHSSSSACRETILDRLMEKPVALLVKKTSSIYSRDEFRRTDLELPQLQPEPLNLSGKEHWKHTRNMKGSVDYETIEGTKLANRLTF